MGIVGRNAASATLLAARAFAMGLSAAVASGHRVADADLVVCCAGSSLPLFDGSMVKEDAVVIAIGSHEPDKRELDDALLSRSSIYIESLDSCQREAGDIILALASGAVAGPEQLNTLADLVQGLKPRQSGRPAVFKTTGMPWQDLAVAAAAYEAYLCESSGSPRRWRPRSRWTSDCVGHAEE